VFLYEASNTIGVNRTVDCKVKNGGCPYRCIPGINGLADQCGCYPGFNISRDRKDCLGKFELILNIECY